MITKCNLKIKGYEISIWKGNEDWCNNYQCLIGNKLIKLHNGLSNEAMKISFTYLLNIVYNTKKLK